MQFAIHNSLYGIKSMCARARVCVTMCIILYTVFTLTCYAALFDLTHAPCLRYPLTVSCRCSRCFVTAITITLFRLYASTHTFFLQWLFNECNSTNVICFIFDSVLIWLFQLCVWLRISFHSAIQCKRIIDICSEAKAEPNYHAREQTHKPTKADCMPWNQTRQKIKPSKQFIYAFGHMCVWALVCAIFNQNELIRENDMQNSIYIYCVGFAFATLPLPHACKFRSKLIALICFQLPNAIYIHLDAGMHMCFLFWSSFKIIYFPFCVRARARIA